MTLPSYKFRKEVFERHGIQDIVNKHFKTGEIREFDEDLWERIKNTNVAIFRDFYMIFEEGSNIGDCGVIALILSMCFEKFVITTFGILPILLGTEGAPKGEHAWLEVDNFVYDTTLLLVIKKDVAYNVLGYKPIDQISSSVLRQDEKYNLQKEWCNNKESLKWKQEFYARKSELERALQDD